MKLFWIPITLICAVPAEAEIYRYLISGEFFNSTFPSDIAIGDTFTITFDLNTDLPDSSPDPRDYYFQGGILALSFTLGPGSTGSYADGFQEYADFHLLDGWEDHPIGPDIGGFTNAPGPHFASASGVACVAVELSLAPLSEETIDLSSGAFPDFATSTLNLTPPYSGLRLYFGSFGQGAYGSFNSVSYTIIPEPKASAALTATAGMLFAAAARRRKRS